MSEVDRLSNSGLYPVIPMGDRRQDPHEAPGRPPPDPQGDKPEPDPPRPPKSIIDEYA